MAGSAVAAPVHHGASTATASAGVRTFAPAKPPRRARDRKRPSVPRRLAVTAVRQTSLSLAWKPSRDNVRVVSYRLYRNRTLAGRTPKRRHALSGLLCGTRYELSVRALDAAGNLSRKASIKRSTKKCRQRPPPAPPPPPPPPPPPGGDPVIAAAGDICWTDQTTCEATATLLDQISPAAVLTLGDNQYDDGKLSEYNTYYKPHWGRHDSRVYPSPGNHEFHVANAQGYRDYFGARAPSLTYSYDLGAWHLVSLAGAGISVSTQNDWLQNDLASHSGQCILAYWHEPRFSSGTTHGSNSSMGPLWTTLYNARAAIVLNGHEHMYERFAPQNPSGVADPNGIREFVVGTGGALGDYGIGTPIANSQVRNNATEGVLKLTLHRTGYDWQFVPQAGKTFTDSGSGACPGVTPPPPPSPSPLPLSLPLAPLSSLGGAPPYRYIYNSGSDQSGAASNGWNLLDVGSKWGADALPAGTRGLVWAGDYDNSSCSWEMSDSSVSSLVASTVGDTKVFGYFFSDEPDPYACPNAPAQHKARSDLIHASDPATRTVMVLDANSGQQTISQIPLWVGKADYVGLDPYPCYQGKPCTYSWIDQVIAAANSAGLSYWGVVQAFNDGTWRWPTAAEESIMLGQWAASRQSGMMTFAWTWSGNNLTSQPALLDGLRQFNLGAVSPPPPSPRPPPPPAPTPPRPPRVRGCVVPAVIGMRLARARTRIRGAHCSVGRVRRARSRRVGRVIVQQPRRGARRSRGARVNLVVGRR